ncbi:lateral signaling target protein 2 homolog isoform X1 [Bactrocera oleae]|uniref:lateral signaling target protein 2 homolog isoform X1 n=1 Tax=Bactrocera oleae TaxID=104688 RepID=UPI00387E2D59
MDTFRKWLNKPKADDKSLLARFYHADRSLTAVASELDSFDGRAEPDRCSRLVSRLRQGQDKVLSITNLIMEELLGDERHPRAFRAKFPEEVLQENLAGQLWFGAECLAAGSSIMHREQESKEMRPLAQAVTKSLGNVRSLLRDQCLRNNVPNSKTLHLDINDSTTEQLYESLKIFDRLFAEFELRYVSAMVQVKTKDEYEMQEMICVLFSETLQRALKLGLIDQDKVDTFDPALMFSIPRLAIITGLVVFPKGPLNMDMPADQLSEMFRPFRTILIKIRDLLRTLSKSELQQLEKLLCTNEDIQLTLPVGTSSIEAPSEDQRNNNSTTTSTNASITQNPASSTIEETLAHPLEQRNNNLSDTSLTATTWETQVPTPNSSTMSPKHPLRTAKTAVGSGADTSNNCNKSHCDSCSRRSMSSASSNSSALSTPAVSPTPSHSLASTTSAVLNSSTTSPADWTDDDENDDDDEMDEDDDDDEEEGDVDDNDDMLVDGGVADETDDDEVVIGDCENEDMVSADCATGYLIPNTNFGNLLQPQEVPLTGNFIASEDDASSNANVELEEDQQTYPDEPTTSAALRRLRLSSQTEQISIESGVKATIIAAATTTTTTLSPKSSPPSQGSSDNLTSPNGSDQMSACSCEPASSSSSSSTQGSNNSASSGKQETQRQCSNHQHHRHHHHDHSSCALAQTHTAHSHKSPPGRHYPYHHHNHHHHHHHHHHHRHNRSRNEQTTKAKSGAAEESVSSDANSAELGNLSDVKENKTSKTAASQSNTSSADSSSASSLSEVVTHPLQAPSEVSQAIKVATRKRFKSIENLLHRLFVCIAGVADQLQTNFAADLRQILRSVFLMNMSPAQEDLDIPEKPKESELFEFRASEQDVIQENAGSNQSIYSAEEVNPELDSVFHNNGGDGSGSGSGNNSSSSVGGDSNTNNRHSLSGAIQRGNTIDVVESNATPSSLPAGRVHVCRSRSLGDQDHSDIGATPASSTPATAATTVGSQSSRLSAYISGQRQRRSRNDSVGSTSPISSSSSSSSGSSENNSPISQRTSMPHTVNSHNHNNNVNNNNNNNNTSGSRASPPSSALIAPNAYAVAAATVATSNVMRNANVNVRISPPAWVPDDKAPRCMGCRTQFTAFRRRHHCRNCGGVFCGVCSNATAPLPKYGLTKAVRVCRDCYVSEMRASASLASSTARSPPISPRSNASAAAATAGGS